MSWSSEGIKPNPAANAVLADTGAALADTTGEVHIVAGATVAMLVFVEHRANDNVTVKKSQGIFLPANNMVSLDIIIDVLAGEHIVVRTNAVIAGSAQASIFSNII